MPVPVDEHELTVESLCLLLRGLTVRERPNPREHHALADHTQERLPVLRLKPLRALELLSARRVRRLSVGRVQRVHDVVERIPEVGGRVDGAVGETGDPSSAPRNVPRRTMFIVTDVDGWP